MRKFDDLIEKGRIVFESKWGNIQDSRIRDSEILDFARHYILKNPREFISIASQPLQDATTIREVLFSAKTMQTLSSRAWQFLKLEALDPAGRLKTVGDMRMISNEELAKTPNIGRKTIVELRNFFE